MFQERIIQMKLAIENVLKSYLQEEKVDLFIAANDNWPCKKNGVGVILESIDDMRLNCESLLVEIRVILRIQGKQWQCDSLVNGIYQALQPHYVTHHELNVLLMSLHVTAIAITPRKACTQSTMRYIVENTAIQEDEHPGECWEYREAVC